MFCICLDYCFVSHEASTDVYRPRGVLVYVDVHVRCGTLAPKQIGRGKLVLDQDERGTLALTEVERGMLTITSGWW